MKRTLAPYLIGLFPLAMMTVFFLAPLGFMVVVSFYERDPLGFYKVAFVWDNYAKFFSSFYYTISMRSLWSASLGAVVVVLLSFPAMYIIVDMHRRWQLFWVILLLLCSIPVPSHIGRSTNGCKREHDIHQIRHAGPSTVQRRDVAILGYVVPGTVIVLIFRPRRVFGQVQ